MKLIARVVIAVLFALALIMPRLISIGSVITVDEPLWHGRGASFMKALATARFSETHLSGHPGVTTMWLVGLTFPGPSITESKTAVSVATIILIVAITYFLTLLWGQSWGLIAGFFIALDPFLLAHSRLVHTDALIGLLYLASLLALLAGLKPLYQKSPLANRYIAISAIAGGLTVLTKLFGLILVPTVILIIVYTCMTNSYSWRLSLKTIFLWSSIFVLTILVFWPALWTSTPAVVDHLAYRLSLHAEGTRGSDLTAQWWYYLREGIFRITVPTTILLPFGLVAFVTSNKDNPIKRTAFLLLLSGLIYATIMNLSGDKSDRYLIFTILTLNLIAVVGLHTISQWTVRHFRLAKIFIYAIPLLAIIWLGIYDARLHPYYLAHYNRLYPIESDHRLGWGEGLEQAAAWISTQQENASVATFYPRVIRQFYKAGIVESLSHTENKDYIVIYRAMFERDRSSPEADMVNEYLNHESKKPVHVITVNNLPYVWIFKN